MKKTILSILTLSIFNVISIILNNPASALTYSNNIDLNFTFDPSMTVSLSSSNLTINDLAPGTSSDSNQIAVNIVTNNVTGYNLSATVGDNSNATTSLTHNSSNDVFTSLSTSDNITDISSFDPSTWGYSYHLDSNTTWSNYSGLPLYTSSGTTLSERYNPADDSINFKIAAKSSPTQTSGEYTNTINFIAVANPEVRYYMQEFTNDICRTLATDDNYTVYDYRDGNDYTVRYVNGNCWMTQNLRITGTISAQYSNFTGEDFDVSQGDLDKTITPNDYQSNEHPRVHISRGRDTGVWYNYCAATAGTICETSNSIPATSDICPASWRLPTSAEQDGIVKSGNIDEYQPAQNGRYSDGILTTPNTGYWWSSTPKDAGYRYYLFYVGDRDNDLGIYSGFAKFTGFNLRCITNDE